MANAREISKRIASFGKTRQITKTMELVATSRMKKTHDRLQAAKPYTDKLASILHSMNLEGLEEKFPLLCGRPEVNRVAVLMISTNRGLCGGFNANVIRHARHVLSSLWEEGKETVLHVTGRKGNNALRYLGYEIASSRTDIGDWPSYDEAAEIARRFMEEYLDGDIDELRIVHAEYRGVASHPPVAETILPLRFDDDGHERAEFLLEPSSEAILESLLPRILENRVFKILLENSAGEQAARRIAMKNATDNADELIRILTRVYNRARQAQITQELAEIVGGAEALA